MITILYFNLNDFHFLVLVNVRYSDKGETAQPTNVEAILDYILISQRF